MNENNLNIQNNGQTMMNESALNNVANGSINNNPNNVVNDNVVTLDPNQFPIITNYCENLTAKKYVTNPAIAREEEIKKTMTKIQRSLEKSLKYLFKI